MAAPGWWRTPSAGWSPRCWYATGPNSSAASCWWSRASAALLVDDPEGERLLTNRAAAVAALREAAADPARAAHLYYDWIDGTRDAFARAPQAVRQMRSAELAAAAVPGARLAAVPGGTHFVPHQNPAGLAAELVAFLDARGRSGRCAGVDAARG